MKFMKAGLSTLLNDSMTAGVRQYTVQAAPRRAADAWCSQKAGLRCVLVGFLPEIWHRIERR